MMLSFHAPSRSPHQPAGEAGDADYCQSLERAEIAREGTDVTIFCYSRMRYVVMQAVAQLEKEGYNPEVRRGSVAPICSLCTHQDFSWATHFQQQACLV
jgi:pyruvate/2-oxoglutarate/acetoin dehydrogenase E1 component